ncbi:hypothetical protein D3C84_1093880 [compost metagenome]
MVVVIAGHHVAAEAGCGQGTGEGGGEADGGQRGMHLQADPGGDIVVGQAQAVGLGLGEDQAQAFGLAKAADDGAGLYPRVIRQAAEHIAAGVELGRQAAEQGVEVAFAGHGALP